MSHSCFFRGRQLFRYFGRLSTWRLFRRAAVVHDCATTSVAWRAVRLYMRERFSPSDVVERGLANPRLPLSQHREHLCDARLHGLQRRINSPHAAMCRDKLMFHSHCRAHGLPVPRLYAILSAYGSRSAGGSPYPLPSAEAFVAFAGRELATSVVVKPRMGKKGRGVRFISRQMLRSDGGGYWQQCSVACLRRPMTGWWRRRWGRILRSNG